MPKPALWTSIRDLVQSEIASGVYPPGARLPTETALAARFGVNRHTVRRAMADLADSGLVQARQGSGVTVTARPTDYRLGRRVRFHQAVAGSGRTPSRRITRKETRPASPAECDALSLAPGDAVHLVEGVSLVDGQPMAAFRSVFPADRLPGFLQAMADQTSLTRALAACGVTDYTRRDTRLTARLADPVLAGILQVPPGAPVLRSVAVNVDLRGQPVEYGMTWFAGDRVTLTVSPDQP